jgi:hypothetical protein
MKKLTFYLLKTILVVTTSTQAMQNFKLRIGPLSLRDKSAITIAKNFDQITHRKTVGTTIFQSIPVDLHELLEEIVGIITNVELLQIKDIQKEEWRNNLKHVELLLFLAPVEKQEMIASEIFTHYAQNGNVEGIQKLLSYDIPVDIKKSYRRLIQRNTALYNAVAHNHYLVAKELLDHGANPQYTDVYDVSILRKAEDTENETLITLIEDAIKHTESLIKENSNNNNSLPVHADKKPKHLINKIIF